MKEIHAKFVEEVRKGVDPEKAAVTAGIRKDEAKKYSEKWLGKQNIKDAIAVAAPPTEAEAKAPKRPTRRRSVRVTRKK